MPIHKPGPSPLLCRPSARPPAARHAQGRRFHPRHRRTTGQAVGDRELRNRGDHQRSVGTALAYPTARELKWAGNKLISVVGARSKDLLVLEDAVRDVSDETYIMTDDGTAGEQGLVTKKLQELVDNDAIDYVLTCGPVPMMRACANITAPREIKTIVSLNSIMVDGTGMCGGC